MNLALLDSGTCTISKQEVQFHIAHCYDLRQQFKIAKERYEAILLNENISAQLRAILYRHLGKNLHFIFYFIFLQNFFSNTITNINDFLGWLHYRAEQFGDKQQRQSTAIRYLRESLNLDNTSGQAWYYLGRYET